MIHDIQLVLQLLLVVCKVIQCQIDSDLPPNIAEILELNNVNKIYDDESSRQLSKSDTFLKSVEELFGSGESNRTDSQEQLLHVASSVEDLFRLYREEQDLVHYLKQEIVSLDEAISFIKLEIKKSRDAHFTFVNIQFSSSF